MKLKFSLIKNGTIFPEYFQHLDESNGTIEFKKMKGPGGLAVVYAPNGTGKSSFANLLNIEKTSNEKDFRAIDDKGNVIVPDSNAFHIIEDQLNRNIIKGKETDYLVGEQIRKEYELRDHIDSLFQTAFINLNNKYKSDFKVSKVGDYLLGQMGSLSKNALAYEYIRDLVKTQSSPKS